MLFEGASDAPQSADFIKAVTEADFMAEVVEKSLEVPVIVDFWAPWCGPCKAMAPEFEKAALQLQGRARLAKIDTQSHPDASVRWNIRGIPAFILFKNGREVTREAGARPAADLIRFAEGAMAR